MAQSKPNFLIFVSDEHNPRISSVYGHPFVQTPNMERLAKMGTVYENAYCVSPLCLPSRSAFLTGRRVHEIQTYNNCLMEEFDYQSYGQVLAEQGVHTAYIGKVHGYRNPADMGFSEMLCADFHMAGDLNVSRKPLAVRPLEVSGGGTRDQNYGPREDATAADDERMRQALEWLRTTAASSAKPWTLSVNISKPHFPMFASPELWDTYAEHEDLPRYGFECPPARHPYARDLQEHFQTRRFSEKSTRGLRRGYYAVVTYTDLQLGRILDALEETGQADNTIVAYTSDHGDMLGKFGMWWKCTLYEDSARIPLIIAGPGFAKEQRVETPVDALDFQAAVFRALACDRPAGWAGTPLQAISARESDHYAFCEYHGHGTRASAYMIRRRNWKLIYYCEGRNQLFDLSRDPDEQENLIDGEASLAAELEAELRRICSPEGENHRAEVFIKGQQESAAKMNLVFDEGNHAKLK